MVKPVIVYGNGTTKIPVSKKNLKIKTKILKIVHGLTILEQGSKTSNTEMKAKLVRTHDNNASFQSQQSFEKKLHYSTLKKIYKNVN